MSLDAVFSGKRPKARTEHTCEQCGRSIAKGETYLRAGGVFDGRVYTVIVCVQCEGFVKDLKRVGFEDDYGNFVWLPEVDAGEVAYCGFSREYSLYRARWRLDDGTLYEYVSEAKS